MSKRQNLVDAIHQHGVQERANQTAYAEQFGSGGGEPISIKQSVVPREKYRVVEMSFTNSMRNGAPYPWAECMSDYLNLHDQAGNKLFACYPAAERATFVFIWELPC